MDRSERENYARNKARALELEARTKRIRDLNDAFRTTLTGGRVMITSGVQALGPLEVAGLLRSVATFESFTLGSDPYEEHDFGGIIRGGHRFFWKIDYYDKGLEAGSRDPADETITARVLTIMLAEEY